MFYYSNNCCRSDSNILDYPCREGISDHILSRSHNEDSKIHSWGISNYSDPFNVGCGGSVKDAYFDGCCIRSGWEFSNCSRNGQYNSCHVYFIK